MSTGPARRAGRAAALVVSVVGTAAQAAAHLAASPSHTGHTGHDGRMVLAHVLAAVLTAAVVARRGAALRRLVGLLDALLPPAHAYDAARPVLDLRTAPPVVSAGGLVLVGRLLATSRRRRGPPASALLRPATA